MSKKRFNPYARRRSRQLALQAFYAISLGEIPIDDAVLLLQNLPNYDKSDVAYLNDLFMGVVENQMTLDILLKPHLDREFSDLDPVELSILRLSTYELLHYKDIPARVAINEAIELAKLFGSIEGHKYVNGILDKIAKQIRLEDMGTKL